MGMIPHRISAPEKPKVIKGRVRAHRCGSSAVKTEQRRPGGGDYAQCLIGEGLDRHDAIHAIARRVVSAACATSCSVDAVVGRRDGYSCPLWLTFPEVAFRPKRPGAAARRRP
jgi:hypothetical protein